MQPQDSCATLESHNIKSGHMVKNLKQFSTMLTMIL